MTKTDGPVLEDFTGVWQLTRLIADDRQKLAGEFQGTAVFRPARDGLRYHETGALRYGNGPPVNATQRHIWRPHPSGIAITFYDDRPFHLIGPGPQPQGRHDCPPDLYQVAYDFTAWPVWTAAWNVSGPRKAYVMTTTYRRQD